MSAARRSVNVSHPQACGASVGWLAGRLLQRGSPDFGSSKAMLLLRGMCSAILLSLSLLPCAAWAQPAITRAPQAGATCGPATKASDTPASPRAPSGSAISYGMNFNWWRVDLERVSMCSEGKLAATTRTFLFLPVYDTPAVRNAVRDQLNAMHKSGFDELRTMIFFSPEPIENFFQLDKDNVRAGQLVRQYASDVASAGFRHLELEFTPSATASPTQESGADFDPQTIPRTIAFILGVRRTLGDTLPLDLSIDLANEACNWHWRRAQSRSNLSEYLPQLVSAYVSAFPRDKTTISCPAARMTEGRASIDSAYAAAGRRGPDYYEVHLYYSTVARGPSVPDAIEGTASTLSNTQTPIVLGETGYGDGATLREIVAGLGDVGGKLRAVYFWPKRSPAIRCNADTAPPYLLKDALGE